MMIICKCQLQTCLSYLLLRGVNTRTLAVYPATWLGHRAKGLVGLGFETQCRHGPGWVFGFAKWVPASAGSELANLADKESGLE